MVITGLIATAVNATAVVIGSLTGFFLKKGLPDNV
jgi:uncharacterized membrane protein YqgA involved in biofilm formation